MILLWCISAFGEGGSNPGELLDLPGELVSLCDASISSLDGFLGDALADNDTGVAREDIMVCDRRQVGLDDLMVSSPLKRCEIY